jgi:hypothetical protein
MRALTYVLALVATPLLYGLAFPPWRLAALAWIALAPWLVALRLASTTTRAVLIASVTTLAASAVVAGWLPATPPDTVPPFALVWLVTVAPAVVLFTLCYRAAAARRDASIGVSSRRPRGPGRSSPASSSESASPSPFSATRRSRSRRWSRSRM